MLQYYLLFFGRIKLHSIFEMVEKGYGALISANLTTAKKEYKVIYDRTVDLLFKMDVIQLSFIMQKMTELYSE